ncbi:ribbon-helix-helix protein, CopG family [Patescibacteria group bacterium]|nr:ribbon-helix-helix protein, CopG family [Patescibacteria group bacterium]
MQTINISLPERLANKIDQVVSREGYSSRSEFVRALLRFYLATKEEEMTLLPFRKVPLGKVEKSLKKTGRYKDEFIKSVVKGLSRSSLYVQDKAP